MEETEKMCVFDRDRPCNDICVGFKEKAIAISSTVRWDTLTKSYGWVRDREPKMENYCRRGEFFIYEDIDEEIDLTGSPHEVKVKKNDR